MKRLITILVVLMQALFCTSLFAQALNTQWVHTYDMGGDESASALIETGDGGFFVLGNTNARGAGGTDALLIRTNATGDTLWSRTYGGAGDDGASDFCSTLDGGCVIAAASNSWGNGHWNPYCLRLNSLGDTLWTRVLTSMPDGSFTSVCRANDRYVFLGNANGDVFLDMLDDLGNTIWTRFLGVGGSAQEIRLAPDGGFVMSGRNGYPMIAMKTDSVGNVLWYQSPRGGASVGVTATTDGGLVIVGDGYGYFTGDRFDASGNHTWSQTYSGYYGGGLAVIPVMNGNFLLGGFHNSNAGWSGGLPFLVKTNGNGDAVWSTDFPDLPNGLIRRGTITGDRGYALIGSTAASVNGDHNIFLIKIAPDPSNRIPCPPASLPFVDNFNGPPLDSCWYWIREDTSHWSLTARPGWMRIITQWGPQGNASVIPNTLIRDIANSDFVISTKLDFNPAYRQAAGLVIGSRNNPGTYLHFFRDNDPGVGPNGALVVHNYVNGSVPPDGFFAIPWTSTLNYLTIVKHGHSLIAGCSPDSINWTWLGPTTNDLGLDSIVYAGCRAQNYTWTCCGTPGAADYDYVRVDPLPATDVCGNVSGIWDTTGSPYYVTCDVTVPAGQTLEIRPGVHVLFMGHYKFNVNGNLQAIGTEQDSIIFTRAFPTEESKWWGIRFVDAQDTSRLQYCIIEYGNAVAQGDPNDNQGGGIWALNSSLDLQACTIRNNHSLWQGGGARINYSPYLKITNCVFADNTSDGTDGFSGGGLFLYSSLNAVLAHDVFRGNHGNYTGGAVIINTNVGPAIPFTHCTFYGNSALVSGSAVYYVNSIPALDNSIVWNNTGCPLQLAYEGSGLVNANYSDIQGGYPGTGNINADPNFVDSANGDFHLQAGSPCVDTADPSSPPDPDGTRADMGAFPYMHTTLFVNPSALDFGLIDLGTDSVRHVLLFNPTAQAIPVVSISHAVTAFSVDTAGLGGQVPPHASYQLVVAFNPALAGVYADTINMIVSQQGDSLIRIPLHGEAEVILPPVDSLVAQKGSLNGIRLDWAPVTHSISGQPVQDVMYVVYGSTNLEGPFVPFGYSTTNTYTHPYILNSQATYFYRVTADVGSRSVQRMPGGVVIRTQPK